LDDKSSRIIGLTPSGLAAKPSFSQWLELGIATPLVTTTFNIILGGVCLGSGFRAGWKRCGGNVSRGMAAKTQ